MQNDQYASRPLDVHQDPLSSRTTFELFRKPKPFRSPEGASKTLQRRAISCVVKSQTKHCRKPQIRYTTSKNKMYYHVIYRCHYRLEISECDPVVHHLRSQVGCHNRRSLSNQQDFVASSLPSDTRPTIKPH